HGLWSRSQPGLSVGRLKHFEQVPHELWGAGPTSRTFAEFVAVVFGRVDVDPDPGLLAGPPGYVHGELAGPPLIIRLVLGQPCPYGPGTVLCGVVEQC